jgi:hypothetical protein
MSVEIWPLHEGRFEYIHHSSLSCRRWQEGTQCLRYNWATLFLGDRNTGTWPTRLGESQIWDGKIWSWVLRDSDLRITALARASSNCKWQTCPLFRKGASHQQSCNCLTIIKIWYWAPDGCLTPRQTDWLTVGDNIILALALVDIWSSRLGTRQSPSSNDVSRRGQCWDPLPGNH